MSIIYALEVVGHSSEIQLQVAENLSYLKPWPDAIYVIPIHHDNDYCGMPGLEFRILCLEDSVISIISPSSGGSPGPV